MMTLTSALFDPIKIGSTQLAHRVVLAPLTRHRSDKNHVPTDLQREYYEQRATKGGLLISEATFISPMAGGYRGAPGIYNDEMISGWKKITDAVHAKGSVMYSQLWHVGRATGSSLLPNNAQPVSASAIAIQGPNTYTDGSNYEVPHALTVDEIAETIQDYVKAAKNAIAAGFDGVEIHGANGFLPDQFTNSSSNKRTDQYGGSVENRARFVLEVTDAVIKSIGAERVSIRMSPWSEFQDIKDDTPYETWGYIIDQIQENHPNMAYVHMIEPRDSFSRSSQEEIVNSLDPFRAKWKGTFISAGGYTNPDLAIDAADKTGGMIAIGRAYIANPDLVYRLKHGLPLNKYDRSTFYGEGPVGYTDYPFTEEVKA